MVRTRFAPSPTGYIHLGNVRTAFLCWLFAKKHSGKFYIRIDDTDELRNSQKYVNNIVDTLNWFNITSENGLIFQSKNHVMYKKFLDMLLNEKRAYKCFCDKDRLHELKIDQINNKKKIRYDSYCKNLTHFPDKPFIIRFDNNYSDKISFVDLVKGVISIDNSEFDDFIIAKHNFLPTYNFASVVDDISFGITHIIRGDDHVSNTIKQINLMNAFKIKLPEFAHLPMILDENRKVLSKRDNKSYINYYIENGFLPIALLNYIIRLGWSFNNQEIFSLDEMIKFFDFSNVASSSSAINYDKLIWLNKYYMRSVSYNYLLSYFLPIEKKFKLNYLIGPTIKNLLEVCSCRSNTLKDIILDNIFLYQDKLSINDEDYAFINNVDAKLCILKIYDYLKVGKFFWTKDNIKIYIKNFCELNVLSISYLASLLRIIIVGNNKPNSLYEILFLSGKTLILKKIRNIIKEAGAIAQHG